MPLISAKDYLDKKGKLPSETSSSSGGLISAGDFKARKSKTVESVVPEPTLEQTMVSRGLPTAGQAIRTPLGVTPAQRQESAARIAARPPELPGRDLAVIGPVLRALDVVEANPIRRKAGEIAQELYTPGAGLGAINTLTRGAGNLVSRVAPGLAGSLGGRVAQTAATEAITGVPLAAAQYLSAEGDTGRADLGEAARQGLLYGGLAGGALGAAAPLLGAGVRGIQRGVQNVARADVRPELATAVREFSERTRRPAQTIDDAIPEDYTGISLTNSGSFGGVPQVRPSVADLPAAERTARRADFVNDALGRGRPAALPASRGETIRQRAAGTILEPGTTPIRQPGSTVYDNPELMAQYRGLPEPSAAVARRAQNYDDASRELAGINEKLSSMESKYQKAVSDQYDYLKSSLSSRGGVQQGGLIRDTAGDVTGRFGRISENPQWYQDFYRENGHVPTDKQLRELAKKHVDEGFQSESGFVPSWRAENGYDDTIGALTGVRDELRRSMGEMQPGIVGRSSMPETVIQGRRGGGAVQAAGQSVTESIPSGLGRTADVEVVNPGTSKRRARTAGNRPASGSGLGRAQALQATEVPQSASGDAQYMRLGANDATPAPAPTKRQPGLRAAAQTVDSGVQNYAGNQIPFRQGAVQNERTINRNRIVKNIKKNLGVTIDQGRLPTRSRGVLGVYKIQPEVVRTRMAEDIQAIAHEVGHHLDKKFGLDKPQFQRELYNLLRQNNTLNIAGYQPSQLGAEGVAEYLRLFMTDPNQARRLAPNFTRYLDAALDKKTMDGLLSTQRDIDTWITQGDYNQAKGLIDFESGGDKEKFSLSKTYTRFLDDLNPLKIVEKTLKGAVQMGSKSLYKLARLSRGSAEWAQQAVTRGIYDAQGNKISEGLRQIVEPLEKMGVKEEDFATYLAVKHAQDLKKLKKQVPFTDDQMRAVMQKLDTPEMQAVQQGIIKYNNALLDVLVEAQVLSRQAVNDMRKRYPNYVPFLRYFDDAAEAGFKNGGFGAAKAFANITNPLKRMSEEGSTRTILNPMESIVKNTFLAMNAAAKNKVGLQLADLANIDGAGAWVEALGKGGSSPGEHVVSVFQNGERHAYKIREPELYNAMLSLDNQSSDWLIKSLGGLAGLLRSGATLTPEFTIRNAIRDVVGTTVNSVQYGFNPLDFFKGLYHTIGKTDTFEKFVSSGGAISSMQPLDRASNREALKAVFHLSMKDKAMNIVKDPKELAKLISGYTPAKTVVRGLRKAAEVSELSTRVGAFNRTLRKTGDLQEAAYTARDLMDFARAGSSIRQANRAIAFLNASLQGVDKMRRSFVDSPGKFLTRALTTLVMPTVALHFWNSRGLTEEKKKIYDNIPQWQKDSFFIIPGPGNEFFRIPKPFEAGMLFSTGTDRMLRWFADNDPEAYDNYGRSVLEAVTPPVLFTALTPALEAITNYSFFRKAPIVPQGEQGLEKKDQYGIYTSEVAKLIGKGLSYTPLRDSNIASPRIIDNTIRGYTAGLGQYAVSAADQGIKALTGNDGPERPAQRATELPFARSFFVSTAGGGQVREDFYDKWNDVSREKASADRDGKPYQSAEYQRLKMAKAAIDKLNKQYKITRDAKDVNSTEKRSRMDELDAMMNEIAAQGLGRR